MDVIVMQVLLQNGTKLCQSQYCFDAENRICQLRWVWKKIKFSIKRQYNTIRL